MPWMKYLVIFSLVSCVGAPVLDPKPNLFLSWLEADGQWYYCNNANGCLPMKNKMIVVEASELKRLQDYEKLVLNSCKKWK